MLQQHLGGEVDFVCSINNQIQIEKDVEITVYRAIVAVLNTMYKTDPSKIAIHMKSNREFRTTIEVYYEDKPKVTEILNFEEQIKRIQLQGGIMSVSNNYTNKVQVNIHFSM